MSDTIRVTCPVCACPEQHIGMQCGFCGNVVPVPADVPQAIEREVIGYRGFIVRQGATPADIRLTSPLFTDTVWEPGQTMIAECRSYGRDPHDEHYHGPLTDDRARNSPVKDCKPGGHGCGFYAGRTWNHLVEMNYANYTAEHPRVIGKVQMEGKIIFATNGFRAEKVWPLTIYVPYELWEIGRDLKAVYGPHGVEIEMGATMLADATPDAPKWCAKCGAALEPRNPTCPFCSHTHR